MIVDVEHAARLLAGERVVAYPTETVYGLGADAESPAAIEALHALKGRDADRAVSVLVSGLDELLQIVPDLPETARDLARRYWPGPLTLVVPVDGSTLRYVRSERGVGFRCSPHPTAAALRRAVGRPVVSTSCNRSGDPPCRTAAQVESAFGPELCVAGGEPAGGGEPSTVVSVDASGRLELLREGALSWSELRREETT
ncbi:MAG: threonylcarbamoyl-AMP synthase [Deltaproteobacteria bacterium]|nr:threonylcarbamoyl-AMP synthase [Deltaproteobacteria bacterium]MBW2415119.1 threonylcarbamoyl-AMP synthase [Deltaproteobacteria bacterium]